MALIQIMDKAHPQVRVNKDLQETLKVLVAHKTQVKELFQSPAGILLVEYLFSKYQDTQEKLEQLDFGVENYSCAVGQLQGELLSLREIIEIVDILDNWDFKAQEKRVSFEA